MLRDPAALEALVAATSEADRLVLLGDLIELRHGPERLALEAAQDPLRRLGAALGPDGEVVIVPGNHDHNLLSGWFERRGLNGTPAALSLETEVIASPEGLLSALVSALAPAQVRMAYPGVWLREDVYAIHGHYVDVHMTMPTVERIAAGVMTRITGRPATDLKTPEDYEAVLAPMYAWIHALAQRVDTDRGGHLHGGSVRGWRALSGPGRRGLRRWALAGAFPVLVAALNRAGVGPLRAEVSGPALRQAGLRGMDAVGDQLGIPAPYVIFGHTHRAGPLPGDNPADWRLSGGGQLINSGGWVRETSFTGPDPSRSPYRPGFAVWLEDAEPLSPPRLVNLLDR